MRKMTIAAKDKDILPFVEKNQSNLFFSPILSGFKKT